MKPQTEPKPQISAKPKEARFSKKWIAVGVVALLAAGLIYSGMGRTSKARYDWAEVKTMDLRQEVSVTGRVKPAQSADLAFESGGKAEKVLVEVGDAVKAGDLLVSLNSDDLKAQLRQANAGVQSAQAQFSQYQAALESQQARLAELKAGTRPEEIQVAETGVLNAEKSWEDAKRNLQTIRSKAEADLDNVYSGTLTALQKSVNTARASLNTLTDVQYSHFNQQDQDSAKVADAKSVAVTALLGGSDAGRWTVTGLNGLSGGAFGEVLATQSDPTPEKISHAAQSVLDALKKVKSSIEAVPLTQVVTSTERASLDAEKANLDNEIITVTNKQQSILVQKAMNENAISAAQGQETTAKNTLASARDQLALKQAGSTLEQIRAQEAQVRQAKASMDSQRAAIAQTSANAQAIQARIDKTVLKAPISGTVTKVDAKVGEIVTMGVNVVSLISEQKYQIESDVAEVDIAKIKLGNPSAVTLDAYGSTVEFKAAVTKIDPAETIVEGVPTYKVTLEFTEDDPRIRSGMTANLDILTEERKGVLAVPQRAVIATNGSRSVRILVMENDAKGKPVEVMKEVPVKLGIRGVDGNIEIVEGLKEGDRVVTFIKQ